MQIVAKGILSHSQSNSARSNLTFPSVTALADGSLLATYRAGSTKDSADESVELVRSRDGGATWSKPWAPFEIPDLGGRGGSMRVCYLTELNAGRLLAAAMWIDRTTYPGKPLFNEETEGCLPMSILLAESDNNGSSWSPWRKVPMPDEIGPASLTNPVLKLADGSLALTIETNKQYDDTSPWMQKVVFFHSTDQGQTWGEPIVAGQDPAGRIFNWDLRCGVSPGGQVVTFAWTYDSAAATYLNIHRRISEDHGHTWRAAEVLDFADQPARPAILPDGRVVLAYVDRFRSHSIRARIGQSVDTPFDPNSEVVLYTHDKPAKEDDTTGELLTEMNLWTFGLPYGEVLPDGDVLVAYYAGTEQAMDIHWVRLHP